MITTLFLLLGTGLAAAQLNSNTFYPASVRNGNEFEAVGYGNKFYSFSLPSLSLIKTLTFDDINLSSPATFSSDVITFSDGSSGQVQVDTTDYDYSYFPSTPAPASDASYFVEYSTKDEAGNTYTFVAGSSDRTALINKTDSNGNPLATLSLSRSANYYNVLSYFQIQDDTLYAVAAYEPGRGSTDFDFFSIKASTLSLNRAPVSLPNTANSGCPAAARYCGVPVVQKITVYNDVVVYLYTIAQNGAFQVYLMSYDPSCGFSSNSFDDIGNAPSPKGDSACSSSAQTIPPANPTSSTTPPATSDSACLALCGDKGCCNDVRIGLTCFDKENYHCTTDAASQNNVLCYGTDESCNDYCYDTKMYKCEARNLALL